MWPAPRPSEIWRPCPSTTARCSGARRSRPRTWRPCCTPVRPSPPTSFSKKSLTCFSTKWSTGSRRSSASCGSTPAPKMRSSCARRTTGEARTHRRRSSLGSTIGPANVPSWRARYRCSRRCRMLNWTWTYGVRWRRGARRRASPCPCVTATNAWASWCSERRRASAGTPRRSSTSLRASPSRPPWPCTTRHIYQNMQSQNEELASRALRERSAQRAQPGAVVEPRSAPGPRGSLATDLHDPRRQRLRHLLVRGRRHSGVPGRLRERRERRRVGRQAFRARGVDGEPPGDRGAHDRGDRLPRRPAAGRSGARGDAQVGRARSPRDAHGGARPHPGDDRDRPGRPRARLHPRGDRDRRSVRAHGRAGRRQRDPLPASGRPRSATQLPAEGGPGDHLVAGNQGTCSTHWCAPPPRRSTARRRSSSSTTPMPIR